MSIDINTHFVAILPCLNLAAGSPSIGPNHD
jgi:hypothetical protein